MSQSKNSAIYRFFAFLALSCAIATVAWVIRDFWLMVIGISGVALGHLYSWRQRNISVLRQLILLFFMVLTAFLGGDILLSGFGDRLLLSRYLIYGLVIGSFDLIKPRNVISSLILGGLLLVLVSEVALNLWFLGFMTVFTILALMAGAAYRTESEASRSTTVDELRWPVAAKFWITFSAGTLLVSGIFFLLMPRLASSQMRQAGWLPSRLDLSLGQWSMLPSKPGASVAPGILASSGNGEAREYGDYAPLVYIGNAADTPVMQVRSRISSYWRGLTLDKYDGHGWLNTSPQSELSDLGRGELALPDSRVKLPGEREYWQAYYLLSDQPNAIFTGYWPGKIYLPEETLHFLERGSLYRVLSPVPDIRPDVLRNDAVVSADTANLALPPITERTATLAESIVRGATTDYDKAIRLERFLLANYPYDLSIVATPPDKDAVDYFLFEQQAGYCSHFATVMAVMARHVGLPARVAAGYLPGYIDTLTGAHVVRAGDAHAWVEINFRRHGWVAFDPTPKSDAAMGFATMHNPVYFGLENLTGVSFTKMLSPLAGNLSLGSFSVPGWFWVLLPVGGVIIILIIWLTNRYKRTTKGNIRQYSRLEGDARRSMLQIYDKTLRLLIKKGLPPHRQHQPLFEYSTIIAAQIGNGRETMQWLTHTANSAAYDPAIFDPSVIPEARQKLTLLKQILKNS